MKLKDKFMELLSLHASILHIIELTDDENDIYIYFINLLFFDRERVENQLFLLLSGGSCKLSLSLLSPNILNNLKPLPTI